MVTTRHDASESRWVLQATNTMERVRHPTTTTTGKDHVISRKIPPALASSSRTRSEGGWQITLGCESVAPLAAQGGFTHNNLLVRLSLRSPLWSLLSMAHIYYNTWIAVRGEKVRVRDVYTVIVTLVSAYRYLLLAARSSANVIQTK